MPHTFMVGGTTPPASLLSQLQRFHQDAYYKDKCNYPFKGKTDRLMEHVIMQQVLSCPPNQGVLERNETPVTLS